MRARNPWSDLEAIAAMPNLEVLADVIDLNDPITRRGKRDPLSLLLFLAGTWAFGSENVLDSTLQTTPTWEFARASAAKVGRKLPMNPPSPGQVRHLLERGGETLVDALAEALVPVSVDLAREAGFFTVDDSADWSTLRRENVIYGDGSVFRALSDVTRDADTGEVQGSRANPEPGPGRTGPRMAPRWKGKDGEVGVPVALVGAHGGRRLQRVVLGVELFKDGDEFAAARALASSVRDAAGDGLRGFSYDLLMQGVHLRDVMRVDGVLPLVEMPGAQSNHPHLPIPESKWRHRGNKVTNRARCNKVDVVRHGPADGCVHVIWAVDGALRWTRPGDDVTWESPLLQRRAISRSGSPGAYRFIAEYRLECREGTLPYTVELSGDRAGKNRKRQRFAVADWVRAITPEDAGYDTFRGWRQDVESTFATLKRVLDYQRASRLQGHAFLLSLVGAALWTNAVAWDVHAAQHTTCGKMLAEHHAQ